MRFAKEPETDNEIAPNPWRRRVGLVLLVVVLLAGGGIAITRYQAQQKSDIAGARENERRALEQLASAEAALTEPELDVAERVRRLEILLRAQRAVAAARPGEITSRSVEIRRTEQELDRLRSGDKLQLSLAHEQTAIALTRAGNLAAAELEWRQALQLQREVNRGLGETVRNLDRELRLGQELTRAIAEPMTARVQQLLQSAASASDAGRWEEALALFREARALQERLNREFGRSRYSDIAVIARIDAEIASLTDDRLDARVFALWEQARHLASGTGAEEAAKVFAEAAAAQRMLNERFPRSRFVSMERLEQIEADRQTVLAAPLIRRAQEIEQQARGHLRQRRVFQAQALVREALESYEKLRTEFPRARGVDETLRLQLAFLKVRSPDLAALQDRCYEQLAPLPGQPELALWRTEVTQEDFARVMNTNPSRVGGRALPVDSVTQTEAEEFCRRLSWVLGHAVRLPRLAEMQVAAADAADFAQLNDGLAEWLQVHGGEAGTAPVWKSTDASPESAARNQRSAQRGFRVAVEVNLTAAGGN